MINGNHISVRMAKSTTILHLKSFLASPYGYLASRRNLSRHVGHTRWGAQDSLRSEWNERTALMAGLIPENSTVLEYGAGNEHLRTRLPKGCTYQPSDIVARSEHTFVCDLNETFSALDRKWDVIVFSGVLEYIHDLQKLLNDVRGSCGTCILSYATTDALECMTTRMRSGWVNHLSAEALEAMIARAQFSITQKQQWNGQDIYVLR